jgi:hypothetical protein
MSNVTALRPASDEQPPVPAPPVPGFEDMPAIMSPKALAAELDTTIVSLQRWRVAKTGPAFIHLPGTSLIRYTRADVVAWMLNGRTTTKETP